jgi:CMP/dCMP kinase
MLQLAVGLGGTPTLVERPRTSPGQAPSPNPRVKRPRADPLPQGRERILFVRARPCSWRCWWRRCCLHSYSRLDADSDEFEALMFPSIVSITGDLGSGKSTVARRLASLMDARLVSTGSIQRDMARDMGMDTLELNKYAETHPEIDRKIDQITIDLATSQDRLVLDSRMAWHFVPNSFKIYLEVDPSIAAGRLIGDSARSSERYPDFDSALRFLLERRKLEHERFMRLYSVDDEDITNFDLVINSSLVSPEEIVAVIADITDKHAAASADRSVWLSPKLLIPTQDVRALADDDRAGPIGERGNGHPIEVIRWHRCYFILNGHKRTSSALAAQRHLIPVRLMSSSSVSSAGGISVQSYLKSCVRPDWVHDWEDVHSFRFASNRCVEEVVG